MLLGFFSYILNLLGLMGSRKEKHMPGTDSILRFCRALLVDDKVSMENFSKAAALYCKDYDLAKVVLATDIPDGSPRSMGMNSPKGPVKPSTVHKELIIYEDPDITEYGEPIRQGYKIGDVGKADSLSYPKKGKEYTETELNEIEIIQAMSFYYFGRIRLEETIQKSAMTQYLTGLPNSGGYMTRVSEIFNSGNISNYDAYYINVKGFGMVSKKFGFRQGDEMIRQFAHAIAGFASEDEIVAHLGGDNFVALVKKAHYAAFVAMLSEVTVHAVQGDKTVDVKLGTTIGVWHIDKDMRELSELISLPAIALNAAKNVLHQPICHVSDELLYQVSEQKRVLERFPAAIRNREFVLFYQPKVDSKTNMLAGAEALVRWQGSDEIVPPGAFIPILEREGAIRALDLYVLEQACMDIRKWIDMGLEPVQVSVNISRKDLDDRTLPFQICDMIDRYKLDHNLIQIEITETTDETEHGIMADFLSKLYDMGISTAIDDFGSGYSSLSTLRNFKISTLKIDRSFINNDTFSKNDEIILSDIIHMAGMLGVEVITEGVERPDQLEFMQKVGCNLIQGFLYDRPLPTDVFTERLKDKVYNISF